MTFYAITWYADGGDKHDYYSAYETIIAKNGTPVEALAKSFEAMDVPPGNMRAAIVTVSYAH